MQFNDDAIAALTLPEGKSEEIHWCDGVPGFGVRLRGDSKVCRKTYVIQYRVGKKQRRESFGLVTKVRLVDATKAAKKRFAQIMVGQDPVRERELAEQAEASKTTFAAAAQLYLKAKRSELRPATIKAAELHLLKYWSGLNTKALDAIRRADIAIILQSIISEHGRTAAARARSNLKACFAWAMEQDLVEQSPVIGTSNPDPKTIGERVLTSDEIKTVWSCCKDDAFGSIVKLLVLTGCRRKEIGDLRFDELDLERGIMTIFQAERTKTGRERQLILPAPALEILRAIPRREGQVYVFENRPRTGGFGAWDYFTKLLDERITKATGQPMRAWSLHDLRRTCRTGLSVLGIAPHIAELCLGHAKKKLVATYDKHKFQKEVAAAHEAWAAHVLAVVEGREVASNVIAMPSPWHA